jgi:hypothetical protein
VVKIKQTLFLHFIFKNILRKKSKNANIFDALVGSTLCDQSNKNKFDKLNSVVGSACGQN